jgi:hypothetical protein
MFYYLLGLASGIGVMLVPKVYAKVKAWYDARSLKLLP